MGMTTVEKILFLGKVPMFSTMNDEELRLISQLCEEKSFKEGHKVLSEKEHEEEFSLYIIIAGQVKMSNTVPTPEGIEEDKVIRILRERDVFGDIEVFGDDTKPAQSNYTTISNTQVLSIRGKRVYNLMVRYPRIAIEICKYFSKRIREANKKLVEQQ